ncbi:MAG: hypothetical protein WDM90_17320 [Ferruginibacter sp.]
MKKDEIITKKDNDADSTILPEEIKLLDTAGEDDEERELHHAELDDTDEDGELLNESTSANDQSGP